MQEALLRVHRAITDGQAIASPRAYVATVVTRLCIDELRSARARRERYVGEWLPEPLVADDPASHAEMADSLSLAFLVLLERLSPEQRAAFLLREVFDYPYDEIAAIVGKTEDNARQLVARARKHVAASRPRFQPSRAEHEQLAQRFFAAVEGGDLHALEVLLADDVMLHGDGGGRVPALAQPVGGRRRVAKMLLTWVRSMRRDGYALRLVEVNGQPGAMAFDLTGRLFSVLALDIADGYIQAVSAVVNPDKLRHLGPPAQPS